jgi:hypothetical protein
MKNETEVLKQKIEAAKDRAISIIAENGASAVGARTGIPIASLSAWRNGTRKIKTENAIKILEGWKQ